MEAYHSLTIADIPNDYGNNLLAAGTFAYAHYQDIPTAISFYERAKKISPNNASVYTALGVLYTGVSGKCGDTIANLSTALAIDQYQELPYFLLYNSYIKCFKDSVHANAVSQEFMIVFQKNFQKELKKSTDQLTAFSQQ